MPAGGLRPQLVSPLAVGAEEVAAVAGLETTAALGKGAAAGVEGAVSEPPPHAIRSAGRPSNKSLDPRRLFFLIGTKLRVTVTVTVTVEGMNKLSACRMRFCAMSCNQT